MNRLLKMSLFVLVMSVAGVLAWLAHYAKTPLNLSANAQEITIAPKSSLKSIANQLVAQNVIPKAWPFVLLTKIMRKEQTLQAGDYTVNKNVTPYQLILSLNHGKATQGSITLIEGKTFAHMRQKLYKNAAIKATTKNMSDAEILKAIGANETHAEGWFFPDTYYFDRGTEDLVIFKRSYDVMQSKLNGLWMAKSVELPYKSPYEALIMASIIEKETGQASERPIIAGVFLNRLRIGMRLQTDPSVIYGMGEHFNGNIRKKDLQTDTPYNTYTRAGLPPTPIATPSAAAIEAALHPASTKALYFVGKGDGSHIFSENLSAHNRAVVQYQLKRKAK